MLICGIEFECISVIKNIRQNWREDSTNYQVMDDYSTDFNNPDETTTATALLSRDFRVKLVNKNDLISSPKAL